MEKNNGVALNKETELPNKLGNNINANNIFTRVMF